MKKEEIEKALEKEKARSAWGKGVIEYAFDILDNIDDEEITEKNLLGGADNWREWREYSYGGCALIYDVDICHRLCTPSEIKKTKDGDRRPNDHETWMDVQARALYQAARMILKIKKEVEK
jgi:hypothetical protein